MKDFMYPLRRLGVLPLYKGYRQLAYALYIATADDSRPRPSARELYIKAGAYFGVSWRAVESNIKTLVGHAWKVNPVSYTHLTLPTMAVV